MVCPGNHDIFYDLAAYRRTFLMPVESNDDNYYAFDYNGIHFISFSTELFIPFSPQHLWLESHYEICFEEYHFFYLNNL
ncbi:hypothetical protein DFA_08192 [Cavenderia fasciculata]|uniref:Calcineurin-like phosphoesterase domain-containing protein n=1 Tax=Cavenderia fasciculata TaxID=261658 RepID=F4Q5E6_CACFS|nr:uncharacterized protein DFA_08192 [Cavenderia fasciculata]EGG17205.1 hypothetical protein DFA_08192 [Cavenderia fasciculata]|eukprot:XP_004355689.1 hypothetical protein DFA_08192 [Cavenderia fasciculata]